MKRCVTLWRRPSDGTIAVILIALLIGSAGFARAQSATREPRPVTLCHLSHPYVTAQPERLPEKRAFAAGNRAALAAAIDAVRASGPDVVTVAGNLTWFGTEEDCRAVQTALRTLAMPVHVAPGETDLADGGMRFAQVFQTEPWTSFDRDGLHVVLSGAVAKGQEAAFAEWFQKDLLAAESATTVLVLSSWLPEDDGRALELAVSQRVCAWIGGANHGPVLRRVRGLPVLAAPAIGWPGHFSHLRITVQADAVTVELVPRAGQLMHRTTLANPRSAQSMPPPASWTLARHRQICSRGPRLTFVQLSDTQFDDQTDTKAGARYVTATNLATAAVAEINQLEPRPGLALVTGDLTNKGTPAEWDLYTRIVRKGLQVPMRALPGNHDYDLPYQPKTATNATPPELTQFRAATGDTPDSAWETAGVHFIALDTAAGRIGTNQLAWLEARLKQAGTSPVIVVGHYPIDPAFGNSAGEGAAAAMRLLSDHQALAYLCGHRHFWASSGAGGFLNYICNDLCWPKDNGYVIYHVFDDELRVCYKPLGEDVMWELSWPVPAPGTQTRSMGDRAPWSENPNAQR